MADWWLYSIPAIVGFIVVSIVVGTLVYLRRRAPAARKLRHGATPSQASLVDVSSKTRYAIEAVPWRIGRSRTNALTIDDHSVSRVHAEIVQDTDGNFYLVDLESLNGVYVNEQRVSRQPLVNGDIVDVGDIRFQFLGAVDLS